MSVDWPQPLSLPPQNIKLVDCDTFTQQRGATPDLVTTNVRPRLTQYLLASNPYMQHTQLGRAHWRPPAVDMLGRIPTRYMQMWWGVRRGGRWSLLIFTRTLTGCETQCQAGAFQGDVSVWVWGESEVLWCASSVHYPGSSKQTSNVSASCNPLSLECYILSVSHLDTVMNLLAGSVDTSQ